MEMKCMTYFINLTIWQLSVWQLVWQLFDSYEMHNIHFEQNIENQLRITNATTSMAYEPVVPTTQLLIYS
jgi:hypothetical protein